MQSMSVDEKINSLRICNVGAIVQCHYRDCRSFRCGCNWTATETLLRLGFGHGIEQRAPNEFKLK